MLEKLTTVPIALILLFILPGIAGGCSRPDENGNASTASRTGVKTPLHDASANGQIAEIEAITANGADINARDETGKTPLHHAAANGHMQTVTRLLELGADPLATDVDGHAPRHYAEINGHDGSAGLLPAGRGPDGGTSSMYQPPDRALPDTTAQRVQGMKPSLEYTDAEAFGNAIGQPACMLSSEHVCFFAPASREREAGIVFPYLVRAYDELYGIVGRHTEYIIVVYNFPEGHSKAFGGTSNCTLYYDDTNLQLDQHDEWRDYGIPHVSGYIEEMAHNFTSATRVQFGWEMIGWSIGIKATEAVADNSVFAKALADTRQRQAETAQRYVAGGYIFPADIEGNLVDRLHALLLWQCEQDYGEQFWPDFFREAAAAHGALEEAARRYEGDESRNARYQITVECFDRLPGLRFKDRLLNAHISTEIDIKSLHPTEPDWNRRLY